jgi:hypothetical protein
MTPSPELVALMAQRIVVTVHPSVRELMQPIEQPSALSQVEQALDALDRAFHPVESYVRGMAS